MTMTTASLNRRANTGGVTDDDRPGSAADDAGRPDEHTTDKQHRLVAATLDQLGQLVELLSESFDNAQQLDRLEIRSRWLPFGPRSGSS